MITDNAQNAANWQEIFFEFSEGSAPSNIFLNHVHSALDTSTRRAQFLIGNNASNLAEYFMSIVVSLSGERHNDGKELSLFVDKPVDSQLLQKDIFV